LKSKLHHKSNLKRLSSQTSIPLGSFLAPTYVTTHVLTDFVVSPVLTYVICCLYWSVLTKYVKGDGYQRMWVMVFVQLMIIKIVLSHWFVGKVNSPYLGVVALGCLHGHMLGRKWKLLSMRKARPSTPSES
jgi:hypothetical protein